MHLVQWALSLMPSLCPVAKVKKVMFVFLLEILNGDRSGPSESGSFFTMPTGSSRPQCAHHQKPTASNPSVAPLAPPISTFEPAAPSSEVLPLPLKYGNKHADKSSRDHGACEVASRAIPALLPGPSIPVEVVPPPMDKSMDNNPFTSMVVDVEPPPLLLPGPPPFFPYLYIDDHLQKFLTQFPVSHINVDDPEVVGQWCK